MHTRLFIIWVGVWPLPTGLSDLSNCRVHLLALPFKALRDAWAGCYHVHGRSVFSSVRVREHLSLYSKRAFRPSLPPSLDRALSNFKTVSSCVVVVVTSSRQTVAASHRLHLSELQLFAASPRIASAAFATQQCCCLAALAANFFKVPLAHTWWAGWR